MGSMCVSLVFDRTLLNVLRICIQRYVLPVHECASEVSQVSAIVRA